MRWVGSTMVLLALALGGLGCEMVVVELGAPDGDSGSGDPVLTENEPFSDSASPVCHCRRACRDPDQCTNPPAACVDTFCETGLTPCTHSATCTGDEQCLIDGTTLACP